jgi:hypothetical protein
MNPNQPTTMLEEKSIAENSALLQPTYINLPYPPCYYTKIFENQRDQNFTYIPRISYDINKINRLFAESYREVYQDVTRTPWIMGRANTEEKTYRFESLNEVFQKQQTASTEAGINLTHDEVKALTAFAMFYADEFLQGGAITCQVLPLACFFIEYNEYIRCDIRPHIIDREDNQLIILQKKTLLLEESKEPKIIFESQFNILQINNTFTLIPKKNDIQINKKYWDNTLLPKAIEKLETITDFTWENVFHFIPLLCDPDFTAIFFAKLLQQPPEKLQLAQELILLCFSDRPEDKNRITSTLLLQAKSTLSSVINNENYATQPRKQAAIILKNLNECANNIITDHLTPITLFLHRVTNSIKSPILDNNLQELINIASANTAWNKFVGGSGAILVFAGSVIIVAAITLAIATIGGSSIFSAWGMTVGTTLLTKAVTAAGGIAGLGIIVGGTKLINNKPNYLAHPNSPFWNKLTNQAPAESPPALENLDQDPERSGLLLS